MAMMIYLASRWFENGSDFTWVLWQNRDFFDGWKRQGIGVDLGVRLDKVARC
jgi:hypothetical protein